MDRVTQGVWVNVRRNYTSRFYRLNILLTSKLRLPMALARGF